MIVKLLIYFLYVILSAYVESVRIKRSWGIKKNISKFWTVVIAFLAPAVILLTFKMTAVQIVVFILGCIFIRGIFYDPLLNSFRGVETDYQSPTTNSKIDKLESLIKWDFWKQRRVYLYSFLTMLLLYYIFRLLS